jgi:hypothetical protein
MLNNLCRDLSQMLCFYAQILDELAQSPTVNVGGLHVVFSEMQANMAIKVKEYIAAGLKW